MKRTNSLWIALGAAQVTALLASGATSAQDVPAARRLDSTSPPPVSRPLVVVAGFQASANADVRDAWIPVALEETLAWRLRRVPALIVPPAIRVDHSRRELQDDENAPPDWPRVARLMGARLLLTGSCSGPPEGVAVALTLSATDDAGESLATTTIPPGRLFDVLDSATRWALQALGIRELDEAPTRLVMAPPCRSVSALEYYAKATAAAQADNPRDAAFYAAEALGYDPQFRRALGLLAQLEGSLSPRMRAAALSRLRLLTELARVHADPHDASAAELAQGLLLRSAGDAAGALDRFEAALAIGFECNDPYAQLAAINATCDFYLTVQPGAAASLSEQQRAEVDRANLRRAAEWQLLALDMLGELKDVIGELPAANKLALIYDRLGEAERALAMHRRTLEAAQQAGSRRNQATAWMYIGQSYRRHERWQEALDALTRCLELAPEGSKPAARVALAGVYQGMSLTQEAFGQYELAYAQLKSSDDLANQLICLREMAGLHMQVDRREQARATLQEAIDVAHVLELPIEQTLRQQLAQWQRGAP